MTCEQVLNKVIELKKKKGGMYPGEFDEFVRAHLGRNFDQVEYIEKDGEILAFIEWYPGRPRYSDDGRLLAVDRDEESIFFANLVANSVKDILLLTRKVFRWNPEAKMVYWHDMRYGRQVSFPIKEGWRKVQNG